MLIPLVAFCPETFYDGIGCESNIMDQSLVDITTFLRAAAGEAEAVFGEHVVAEIECVADAG